MHRCLSSPSCFKIDQIPSSYSELPVRDPVTSDPSGCCRASAAEWCAAEQVVSVPRGGGERSRHTRLHGPQQTLPLVQRWVPQIYAPHRCSSSSAAPEIHHTPHSGLIYSLCHFHLLFKGVIWCDFKFCFLFGVLQAVCA